MIYSVKIRAVGGKSGAQSVTYSTFDVEAPSEADAARIAKIKARQRYFGDNPDVRVVSITPQISSAAADAPRPKLEMVGTVIRRVPAQGKRA